MKKMFFAALISLVTVLISVLLLESCSNGIDDTDIREGDVVFGAGGIKDCPSYAGCNIYRSRQECELVHKKAKATIVQADLLQEISWSTVRP